MADTPPRHASPAAESGSSTNPNTPRSPVPVQTEIVDDGPAQANSSTESVTSVISEDKPLLMRPKSIDVTKADAMAVWGGHQLPNLFFDLRWHIPSNKACFKLRAAVRSLRGVGRRDANTILYLYIDPERIRELSVDPDPAERMLGNETLLLKFEMDRPPALVVPKTPYQPKDESAKAVRDALFALAGQTSFAVYVKIPRKKLPVKQIQQLSAAAANAGLASLAYANAATLYRGQGGHVIEGDTLAGPADVEPAPPQYSEAAPAPAPVNENPAGPSDYKGKKRRRVESMSLDHNEPLVPKTVGALMDALNQRLDDRLASHKKEVAEMLEKAEARIMDKLRDEMDDRYHEIHDSMLQKVHEGIAEVEDNVMRSLSEAPLTATLTFPNHPWY